MKKIYFILLICIVYVTSSNAQTKNEKKILQISKTTKILQVKKPFTTNFRRGNLIKKEVKKIKTQQVKKASKSTSITATIYGASWSNKVDLDGDGYYRSATLTWDPDVSGSTGSLSVFEKIYYKLSTSNTWTLLTTTSVHTITGLSSSDTVSLDITSGSKALYDYRIDIYRAGQSSADEVYDSSADADLNDFPMETATADTNAFITTWQTTTANETITIPTTGSGYNYEVDWGDGSTSTAQMGNATHSYATAGTYTVAITGTFPRIYFRNSGDKDKIKTIEQWGTTAWTSMYDAFYGCSSLTSNAADSPNLSNVDDLGYMFYGATSFKGNLSSWNVSNVVSMAGIFRGATSFNGNLSSWNVSNVISMSQMFYHATSFNQDISAWDVSNVFDMSAMFYNATSFNQDLSIWDVSNVIDMSYMFYGATSFNQDLSAWDISNVTDMSTMFYGVTISIFNYDNTLIGWSTLSSGETKIPVGITFSGGNSTYCLGETAKNTLINNYGWTITDGGKQCSTAFITTWQTTTANETITIPTTGAGYNYNVDWGDGHISTAQAGNAIHTYASNGYHTITITGTFPRIYFANKGDKFKIKTIEQWGNNAWTSMYAAFYGCINLTSNATDSPNFSSLTNLSLMFGGALSFNRDISGWDVSSVTNMSGMFYIADSFNQDISTWDVSHVTNMSSMFYDATDFNQNINIWDVSNVTDMSGMFNSATTFNQDLSTWNVSNVTNMSSMFFGATSFNQDLSTWDVSNITNMSYMFSGATSFNQDLSDWDISNVTDMIDMFDGVTLSQFIYDNMLIGWSTLSTGEIKIPIGINFGGGNSTYCSGETARNILANSYNWNIFDGGNGCSNRFITTWQTITANESIIIPTIGTGYDYYIDWGDGNTSTAQTGDATHSYATAGTYTVSITGAFPRIHFNNTGDKNKIKTIEQWGNNVWTSMNSAFYGCANLTSNAIDSPKLSSVSDMKSMFNGTTSFTGDVGAWDVSHVTDMSYLFYSATDFNDDISAWNISNVTDMSHMFNGATSFNQDLSTWDISNVTDMSHMFNGATSFNQDLSTWDISNVTDMSTMFNGVTMSPIIYDNMLIGWSTLSTGEAKIPTGINFDGGNSTYCSAETARNTLINSYGWTISDGGNSCSNRFITTWETTSNNELITIPTTGTGYNYDINWGDGNISTAQTGDTTHNYTTAGTYTVAITGTFPRIYFAKNYDFFWHISQTDSNKIKTIEQWGNNAWISMKEAFYVCKYLTVNASDSPNLSNVTDLKSMFDGATSFNGDISTWDVGNVTDMSYMFYNATAFNGDLSAWNVSKATNMSHMFYGTTFNGDISAWDVSNVTNMESMFSNNTSFNSDISTWNVGNVTNMWNTFYGATDFNEDISSWNVSNVTNMSGLFSGATSFNQDLSAWNVSKVTNMWATFYDATSFNGGVGTWDVGNVTKMRGMFYGATSFNQDLSNWNVSNVSDMGGMFYGATSFNQDLGTWDISNVADMGNMLKNVTLATTNYDNTLIGWSTLITTETRIPRGITLDALNCKYSQETARNTLINSYGWTINDAGKDASLGLNDVVIEGFAFYPNPVNDILTISAKEYIKQIQIFNLLGQQVVQKSVNNKKVLLDISSLPQGTYFAIITTDKTRKSVKFLKE